MEREAIKFVFFARRGRRGEPINKTGDEGQRNVGRKKEGKKRRSLSDQFPTSARPTDGGWGHFGCAFGKEGAARRREERIYVLLELN